MVPNLHSPNLHLLIKEYKICTGDIKKIYPYTELIKIGSTLFCRLWCTALVEPKITLSDSGDLNIFQLKSKQHRFCLNYSKTYLRGNFILSAMYFYTFGEGGGGAEQWYTNSIFVVIWFNRLIKIDEIR